MPRGWRRIPVPLVGAGEQSAAAPDSFGAREAGRLKNAVLRGPGLISQQPDWLLADTMDDGAAGEDDAVCGIFPFEQQGNLSGPSQGVVFSVDLTDNDVRLQHLLEDDLTVGRTIDAYTSFAESRPPQMTGFEMFAKLYVCPYTMEAVASRKGMGVYAPAAGGTFTIPTFDLNTGAAGATALLFRGIAKHRGGTIIGWGYFHEDDVDGPHILRYCKYGAPDTWVPDSTGTSAGFAGIGTIDVPIVACAASGQYTIIGKESEIFALDGDYSEQFYVRQIGDAHGPVSTIGMASIGAAAVWMSPQGPATSIQGGSVQLLGTDKVTRRFLQYMDLKSCSAVHDKRNQRVLFALRRRYDYDGNAVDDNFLTELLAWDYVHHQFAVSSLPAQIFCLGTTRGPGLTFAAPAAVSSITAASITDNTAIIGWTPADTAPDVHFQVQWRENGTSDWKPNPAINTPQAAVTQQITGLPSDSDGVSIDVKVRQVRNGQESAWVESLALFTTLAIGIVETPTGVTCELTGWVLPEQGEAGTARGLVKWTPYSASKAVVMRVYRSATDDFSTARAVGDAPCAAGELEDKTDHPQSSSFYYWVRMENATAGTASASVQATPAPLTFSDLPVGDP